MNTIDVKRAQMRDLWFKSGTGPEQVLLIGSCRSVAYLEYLIRANRDNSMTIRHLDPFNWHWNEFDERQDYEQAINSMERDERMLTMLRNTTVYIHEFYKSFGMFNSSRENPKNIFQFGLKPRIEICIPNWNDVHVLGQSREDGFAALEKFYAICRKTSFPEMEAHFREHWRTRRFFWAPNHISRHFTLFIFRQMNDRFLHLPLDETFWRDVDRYDLYANRPDPVSQQDIENFQLKW